MSYECPRCGKHVEPAEGGAPESGLCPSCARIPAAPPEVEAAARSAENRFGRYVRVRLLGQGGMGEVWKGWDADLQRWVALKFPKGADADTLARLQREARAAGRLTHPNVAAIYEYCQAEGRAFIAMQYVEGRTLAEYPRTDRRKCVAFVRDAAVGVAYAHREGILHRDLKPENVMVDLRQDHAYVMDFGLSGFLAADRASSVVCGTPAYMAPEQIGGAKLDERCDVYALGCTLYEVLADRRPFRGDSVAEVLQKVLNADPEPIPGIDPGLQAIVARCMRKEPRDRYATAAALVEDLSRWLEGQLLAAHAPTRVVPPAPAKGRGVAFAAAALALAAGLAFALPRLRRSPPPESRPPQAASGFTIEAPEGTTVSVYGGDVLVYEGPPGAVMLPPGTYRIVTTKGAHRRVESFAAVPKSCCSADPTSRIGSVRIESKPEGAAIEIDGVAVGAAPRIVSGLELRSHLLKLTLPGRVAAERGFVLESAATLDLPLIELAPPGRAVLSFTAYGRRVRASGLAVWLDGAPAGVLVLEPGREHRIHVMHPQIETVKLTVRAKAGEEVRREVELHALKAWQGMVFIPPGRFPRGKSRERVDVGPFYIDEAETTQGAFEEVAKRSRIDLPRQWTAGDPDLPVHSVTWRQAHAFAEAAGKRLPTADEWEKAAAGETGLIYPWGDEWDAARANTLEAGRAAPLRRQSTRRDASPYGCFGMAGNLREWTSTPGAGGTFVVKGGSWDENRHFATAASQRTVAAGDSSATNGFRCAADFLQGLIEED
ncbi:MAG: protein kinase [Planctomycetes bacterium]|nr:protein kinase [Planctomycetota bacterium]